jgi:hypothetical protein
MEGVIAEDAGEAEAEAVVSIMNCHVASAVWDGPESEGGLSQRLRRRAVGE